MKANSTLAPLVAMTFLLGLAPAANAFYLSNQANRDVHPSPITRPAGMVAVSGTATALDNGYPNQYPGKVNCAGPSQCFFGPLASPIQLGYRFLLPMGCEQSLAAHCFEQSNTAVSVNVNMTWDQAISTWRARYGQTISHRHAYSYDGATARLCTSWGTYVSAATAYNTYMLPGTDSCGVMPPLPNQCTVTGGTVDLDHGTLKAGDITGKKKDATRQVSCLRTASIRYTVSGGNPVDLGNGIDSAITVNGVPAGQTITLPAGNSALVIASTLTDKGAQPGAFSKAVVLIQSFM